MKCRESLERLEILTPEGAEVAEEQSAEERSKMNGSVDLKKLLDDCLWMVKRRRSTVPVRRMVRVEKSSGIEIAGREISDEMTLNSPSMRHEGLFNLDYGDIASGQNPYEDNPMGHSIAKPFSHDQLYDHNVDQRLLRRRARGFKVTIGAENEEGSGSDDSEEEEDGERKIRTRRVSNGTLKKPAFCMDFVADALGINSAAGNAANVLLQNPTSIKIANCLTRAIFSTPERHGRKISLEDLLPIGKLYTTYPTSLPVILLSGNELAGRRKYTAALGRYIDAFCIDPEQPLTSLLLGCQLVFLSQHTLVKTR
jgi:hypothetical protein